MDSKASPRWWLISTALSLLLTAQATSQDLLDLDSLDLPVDSHTQARTFFHQGKFGEVIKLAKPEIEKPTYRRESWLVLKIRAELQSGKYATAKNTIEQSLELLPYSIQLRWLGFEVYRHNNQPEKAEAMLSEIESLMGKDTWRYRDVNNQMCFAKFALHNGVDAKKVLQDIYAKAKDQTPGLPVAYLAIGELGLAKGDFDLAARNFGKAIELDAKDPDAHYGMARAFQSSNSEKVQAAIEAALAINKSHVPTLLMLTEKQIAAEAYKDAGKTLARILKVNADHPEAWALKSVLAHLDNDSDSESASRKRALKHWPTNPLVDHVIGRELSQKYRFAEGSQHQRQALEFDKAYMPAKVQLAHDLLRLGQELEGWKIAEQVFDEDQYNVVANNLVALRDNMAEYTSEERNGFVIRMEKSEFETYGHHVFDLVEEASESLTKKYDVELEKPIFIEIFPRQQDFAIRTFGVPGGAGFLGVCFGRVVTMNSPVAQGTSQTNWRSVLWHEFCHVVTLQKTRNKMPRWLSEGISVYEERLANNAWGDSITPAHRGMILGGELTPVSQLSSAFLSPKSSQHLHFAYFESSLVVQYLVEEFGEDKLLAVLNDLARGTTINDALGRHMAPTKYLDKAFATYARKIAEGLGGEADWTMPEQPITGTDGWTQWLDEHPNNYYGLNGLASSLIKEKNYELATSTIDRLAELYGDERGADTIYRMRAAIARGSDDEEAEVTNLERTIALDASDLASATRLINYYTATENWDELDRVADHAQGINPMLKSSHHAMALAADKRNDDPTLVRELKILAALNPFDKADVHYRLASAEYRLADLPAAKRNLLLALEAAPRYRDAHKLLLKVVSELKDSDPNKSNQVENANKEAADTVEQKPDFDF